MTCRSVGVVVSEFGHGWACRTASRADCSGHCGGDRLAEHGAAVGQYGCMAASGVRCTTPDHIGPRGQPISSGAAVRCDSTGERHTVQRVHLCEDVCRYLFLRHLAVSAVSWWQSVTGEWMPEGVPEKMLSCPSGRFQIDMADVRGRRRGESIHARRTVPEQPSRANAGQRSREAQLSLFSGAVGPVGSVETSLRFSWKLSICLAAAALFRLPLPTMTSTPGPRNPKYFVEPAIGGSFCGCCEPVLFAVCYVLCAVPR